jgi:hypothetical protein
MNHAPFLLQAFAARLLATKHEETVSREALAKQGYDVETLVAMIEHYAAVPENERGYAVRATATDIQIRRMSNGLPPTAPVIAIATAAPAPKPQVVQAPHRGPRIGALVSFSARNDAAQAGAKRAKH